MFSRRRLAVVLYFLLLSLPFAVCLIDPISLTIGAGVGLGAWLGGFGALKDQTYCRLTECCNERSIKGDIGGNQLIVGIIKFSLLFFFLELKRKLTDKLYGQHIVIQQLISALEAHLSPHSSSRKPLVMSFHGTPGTGKNFVTDMIAEALYEKGIKSRFIHRYRGRLDFSIETDVNKYNVSKH